MSQCLKCHTLFIIKALLKILKTSVFFCFLFPFVWAALLWDEAIKLLKEVVISRVSFYCQKQSERRQGIHFFFMKKLCCYFSVDRQQNWCTLSNRWSWIVSTQNYCINVFIVFNCFFKKTRQIETLKFISIARTNLLFSISASSSSSVWLGLSVVQVCSANTPWFSNLMTQKHTFLSAVPIVVMYLHRSR